MRIKGKWRSSPGKDKLKEASKRLRVILKTSRKLGVASGDLSGLGAVSRLRAASRGGQEPGTGWLFLTVLTLGVILAALVLTFLCGGLPDILTCGNTTNKEIQIRTMRLDRQTLDVPSGEQSEESTLFNDSEDTEDTSGHLWQPPNLRLRRER